MIHEDSEPSSLAAWAMSAAVLAQMVLPLACLGSPQAHPENAFGLPNERWAFPEEFNQACSSFLEGRAPGALGLNL